MMCAPPPKSVRRTVYFSGRVQGVGFRFTAESLASNRAVTGYVRNLPDGRVELIAEGAPGELDAFQAAIEQAMRGSIHRVDATDAPASGEFSSFQIVT